jgi:hypothetical protein
MQVRCKGDKLTLKRRLTIICNSLSWSRDVACHFLCHKWPNEIPRIAEATPKHCVGMKTTGFWDVMLYSLLKASLCFGRAYRLHLPLKCWLAFSGLHGVLSQKIVLFITITVRTSNPTLCGKFVANSNFFLSLMSMFGPLGYAIAEAVGFPPWWPRFAPGQVAWDLWWTEWHWGRFSPGTSVYPANHHSTKFSIIITRGTYNRPIGGQHAEWTQLDSTPH